MRAVQTKDTSFSQIPSRASVGRVRSVKALLVWSWWEKFPEIVDIMSFVREKRKFTLPLVRYHNPRYIIRKPCQKQRRISWTINAKRKIVVAAMREQCSHYNLYWSTWDWRLPQQRLNIYLFTTHSRTDLPCKIEKCEMHSYVYKLIAHNRLIAATKYLLMQNTPKYNEIYTSYEDWIRQW